MKPTLIDRAIAVVSPKMAAERMRWRVAMDAVSHYDAAGRTRRSQGWKAPTGDATSAARGGMRMRAVARDMVRNNAIARRAVSVLANNIIGDGIIPNVEADSDAIKRRVMDVILSHVDTTSVDAAGRLNLYGLQRQAVESMVVSGEVLWRERPRFASDNLPLTFQVDAIEAEHIDDRNVGLQANGNTEYDGIEFDALQRRVAYRLFREHPEGVFQRFPESTRVLARNVIHLFRVERPGQRRGVSWLAPAMPLMADAYDYADAQLLRQKIAAMWVAFTRDLTPDGADVAEDATRKTLQPGMFEHLPPGRDVTFSDPPKADGYAEHMKAVQRMIAACLDMTYEELTGDLEGVNFSSARIGRMAMQRAVSAAQWTVVIPSLCEPFGAWLREHVRIRTGDTAWRLKWTPPRFPMTDPAREVPAIMQQIGAGLMSRQRAIREAGFDPEDHYREIAEDKAMADRLGVVFAGAPAAPEEPVADPLRP